MRTFFENAPSVFVSNDNGIGILRAQEGSFANLKSIGLNLTPVPLGMAMNQVSLPGIGKVVTGSVFFWGNQDWGYGHAFTLQNNDKDKKP